MGLSGSDSYRVGKILIGSDLGRGLGKKWVYNRVCVPVCLVIADMGMAKLAGTLSVVIPSNNSYNKIGFKVYLIFILQPIYLYSYQVYAFALCITITSNLTLDPNSEILFVSVDTF